QRDRRLPAGDLAVGPPDGPPARRDGGAAPDGDEPPGRAARGQALGAAGGDRPAAGAETAASGGVSLHPPLRGKLDERRRPLLRRSPDGSRLPADICPAAAPHEGDGRPLDAARADLDGGESLQEQGFLALAEHGEVLRADLTPSWHRLDLTMTSS